MGTAGTFDICLWKAKREMGGSVIIRWNIRYTPVPLTEEAKIQYDQIIKDSKNPFMWMIYGTTKKLAPRFFIGKIIKMVKPYHFMFLSNN